MGSSSVVASLHIPNEPDLRIEYDRYGRMAYNPEFHFNHGEPWSQEDVEYLINWYELAGPEEMSFALGRTVKTVMDKVTQLRNRGLMQRRRSWTGHKRIKKETLGRVQK